MTKMDTKLVHVIRLFKELRKREIDVIPAQCVIGVKLLGGTATKAQLVDAMGYSKESAINMSRFCTQGILRSVSTEDVPAEGGAHYKAYVLDTKGEELLTELEEIMETYK